MRQMIDAHEATAKASGARIVFSCGFDSVPFELGVFFVQEEAKRVFGAPAAASRAACATCAARCPAAPRRAGGRHSSGRQGSQPGGNPERSRSR